MVVGLKTDHNRQEGRQATRITAQRKQGQEEEQRPVGTWEAVTGRGPEVKKHGPPPPARRSPH